MDGGKSRNSPRGQILRGSESVREKKAERSLGWLFFLSVHFDNVKIDKFLYIQGIHEPSIQNSCFNGVPWALGVRILGFHCHVPRSIPA